MVSNPASGSHVQTVPARGQLAVESHGARREGKRPMGCWAGSTGSAHQRWILRFVVAGEGCEPICVGSGLIGEMGLAAGFWLRLGPLLGGVRHGDEVGTA